MIEEFIPDGVMMSNRAFYLILAKASCEYIINMEVKECDKKKKLSAEKAINDQEDRMPVVEIFEFNQSTPRGSTTKKPTDDKCFENLEIIPTLTTTSVNPSMCFDI